MYSSNTGHHGAEKQVQRLWLGLSKYMTDYRTRFRVIAMNGRSNEVDVTERR